MNHPRLNRACRTASVILLLAGSLALNPAAIHAEEPVSYFDEPCVGYDDACCPSEDPGCFGSLCCGDTLTGDWCGHRATLAESGILFNGDVTLFYQGVADGGVNRTFNYAGHGDYQFLFDLGKLGVREGLSLQVRAENRWGEFLAADAGVIAPTAVFAAAPSIVTEEVLLTNVLFTQVLNENWTVLFGKLDTLDGDRNPFASGRGKTQFMNTNLVLPVLPIPTIPFATLGAGAVYSAQGMPLAQILVLNATDTTRTSGFDELFEQGYALFGGVNVPVPIAGRLGIHSFNATWNSKTFTSLGQDPRIITGNVPIAETDGSWAFWWSGAQYLYQDPCNPTKGWGLFGRAGTSRGETNPVEFFANFGIGGQSPIRGRADDQFGIGWFYNRFSDELGPIATTALGIGDSSQGIELYYNYAVTPFFRVTPDLQVIEPGLSQADTALILGMRAQVIF